jgi:WD40 repeat protein
MQSAISCILTRWQGSRIWVKDGETTAQATEQFLGHTERVTCVSFTRNGQHIVSGSWDMTVQVQDSTIGALVAGPLSG